MPARPGALHRRSLRHDPSGASHVPASHPHHLPGRRVPQPHLDLADVPVLVARRRAERLAPRAPRRAGDGRRGCRDRRGERASVPEGRISPDDSGIWSDEQVAAFRRITAFVSEQGAVPGHPDRARRPQGVGRPRPGAAASRSRPEEGGWQPVGPSALPFDDGWLVPRELARGRDRRRRRGVRGGRPARTRGRLPAARDPRRARLPAARVPLAALQPAQRRLRRRLRRAHAARCSRSSRRCAQPGRPSCRCPCASRRPTGSRAAGRSRTPSRSPRCSARSASTSSTARPAATRRRSRSRSARATRCRSPRRSASAPASRPAPSA